MEEEEREKKREGLVFYFCWKEGNEQSFLKKQSEMKWLNAKFSVFVNYICSEALFCTFP